MSDVFLKIINMSISATWIVLAVLLLRLLFKKAPKWIRVLLWGVVALRLVFPFSIESVMSLIPNNETVSPEIMIDKTPEIDTGIPVINDAVNPVISQSFAPSSPMQSANPLQILIPVFANLWLLGIAVLLIYTAVTYVKLRHKVRTAVALKDNVYQSEAVVSPFVLGLIKPRIYLPFRVSEQDMEHITAHEQAHIKRRDHWWKPFGFMLLSLHWFNPLIWLGYVLLCRDIELACDEKVIKKLDREQRADYSQALLNCSVNRRMIAACPLAFGELGVKERVKTVLNYKKPAFWIIVIAIIASLALAVCFLTDPVPVYRLGNIEDLKLEAVSQATAEVWISDGATHRSVGKISDDLFKDLLEIEISEEGISNNGDKSNTLVLQTAEDIKNTEYSHLKGVYIHFSADFGTVWVNAGDKTTLCYEVKKPDEAKETYGYIKSYNVKAPAEYESGDDFTMDIDSLKAKFPMYFDLDTDGGELHLYYWKVSADTYCCGLLPNAKAHDEKAILALENTPATIDEMRVIVAYYELEKTTGGLGFYATTMPGVDYKYTIDNYFKELFIMKFWAANPYAGEDAILKEPPRMLINGVTALKGAYSWQYLNPDGTYSAVITDIAHPLELKDSTPYVHFPYGLPGWMDIDYISLEFSFAIKPDEVYVKRWSADCWGKPDAEAEIIEIKDFGPYYVISGGASGWYGSYYGSYIYEVVATWSSHESFEGTAQYSFYTVNPFASISDAD